MYYIKKHKADETVRIWAVLFAREYERQNAVLMENLFKIVFSVYKFFTGKIRLSIGIDGFFMYNEYAENQEE